MGDRLEATRRFSIRWGAAACVAFFIALTVDMININPRHGLVRNIGNIYTEKWLSLLGLIILSDAALRLIAKCLSPEKPE